jgi:PatG Domain
MMSDVAGGPPVEHGGVPAPVPVVYPAPCVTCGQVPGQPIGAQQMMTGPMPGQDTVPGVTRVVGPVLAVGRVRASFPNLGLQREYAEAAGADPEALVASSDLKDLISQDEYRYLAHQVCWMFTVQSADVCVVVPRSAEDVNELVSMAADEEDTVQVLLGQPTTRGTAPDCWADDLPMVSPVQWLSFTIDEFATALAQRYDTDQATPEAAEGGGEVAGGTGDDPRWRTMVRDLFYRLTRRADTTGFSDEDRARNYMALKDPAIYALTWNQSSDGHNLIGINTRQFMRGGRRLVAVRFSFRHRQTQVIERYETLIDTHDLFCFKAAPLTPTYD